MFRNKVLVRAVPSPSTPPPPFLLRQVSFSTDVPSLDIDILCCRLSRRHRFACLPQPPTDALVVYQRCQSRAAAEVVSEIAAAFLDASVGEEEEVVCSGSLVAKAVECGLRCLMLERGWKFVGESIFVESTFAASEERTDLCALNVEVRSGLNDDYEFVVSPDAFRFTALKISDVASSSVMETFKDNKEVSLDSCCLQTACAILPTLQEGHVIGFSKVLPSGQSLDNFTELCSVKHGLETSYSYHAAVKLTCGVSWEKQWFPSPLVLQGSGLQPAPKSVRASKAMSSLRFFIELLTAWNFFGQNQLVIKEQLLVNCTEILPTWDKAISKLSVQTGRTDNSENLGLVHTSFPDKEQSLNLDFRTPKPAVFCSSSAKVHEIAQCMEYDGTVSSGNAEKKFISSTESDLSYCMKISSAAQVTLLKPSFSRSKRADENKTRRSSEKQLLVNCTEILPTWDKAISKLSVQTGTTDNSEDLGLVHTSFTGKEQSLNLDFPTPKPAVFCSSSAKVHEKAQCMDDDGTGNGTSSINHFFSSQPVVLTSSFKSQVTLLKPSFSRSKRADENKTRLSKKSVADSSNKSSETGLLKPSHRSSPKASHANRINSSSAILLNQVIQASEYPKRKHAEFLENSGKGETAKVHQKDCCERRNLDTRNKDFITDVPRDTKLVLDKDVLSAEAIQTESKSMVGKGEIVATKSKRKPAVVKDELTKKAIDHQKDVTEKVAKVKTAIAKDESAPTTKTKAKPNVNKNESTEKVIDHHKRGEMRLLTVAELKCFLSAKKAKVGGSKEVLIQRATELLS